MDNKRIPTRKFNKQDFRPATNIGNGSADQKLCDVSGGIWK
jgi:hypothetical protein